MEEDLNSSKINMGLVLREKEKSVIDILSRHPALNARLGAITEKIDLEILLSKTMRSRTNRYDNNSINSSNNNNNDNSDDNNNKDNNRRSNDFANDIERYRKSAIDLESIADQTLIDMEILKKEKEDIINELKTEINEKNKEIEEYIDRSTMIKHYANLLIKSSNIYVHKSADEIQESDKVSFL